MSIECEIARERARVERWSQAIANRENINLMISIP